MTVYDRTRIEREIQSLDAPAANTTAKGRRLQDLVEYLLGSIPNIEIEYRNTLNSARSGEHDIWIRHPLGVSGLPFTDSLVPVECKNEGASASAAEIRDFASKIRDSGGRDGIFAAAHGISGLAEKSAHHQISIELTHGTCIVVLTKHDFSQLTHTSGLIGLLIDRHTELRVFHTYTSI